MIVVLCMGNVLIVRAGVMVSVVSLHNYWCRLDRHCLGTLLMDCHVAALFMVFDTILRCFLLSGACHEMRLVNMFI